MRARLRALPAWREESALARAPAAESSLTAATHAAKIWVMTASDDTHGGGEGRAKGGRSAPDPIDLHVGGRIRIRRTLLGMTQESLARKL